MNKITFIKQQTQNFDQKALLFKKSSVAMQSDKAIAYQIDTIVGFMDNIKRSSILDVGCGTGFLSLFLAKKAKQVIGIDISKESIKKAQQQAKRYRVHNFQGIAGDIYKHKFNRIFDYIIIVNVVHHVWEPEEFFSVLRPLLSARGKIIIFESNPLNPLFYPFLFMHGNLRSHLTKEYFNSNVYSLKSFIRKSNLSIEKIERYAFFPTLLYNYSSMFITINKLLNHIPLINNFCAFHILICKKK